MDAQLKCETCGETISIGLYSNDVRNTTRIGEFVEKHEGHTLRYGGEGRNTAILRTLGALQDARLAIKTATIALQGYMADTGKE